MYIQPDMEKVLLIGLECDDDPYNHFLMLNGKQI